ncbi:MAG: PA14 domain-containing protein [Dehalococcoidia bacterium]
MTIQAGAAPRQLRLPFPSQPRRLFAALLAIVLATAANARFLTQPPDLIGGAFAFLVSTALLRYALPVTGPDLWENEGRWPSLLSARRAAVVAGLSLALLSGSIFLFAGESAPNQAWLLYLAAIAGTVAAAWLLPDGTRRAVIPSIGRAEIILVALATAVGLWLRTIDLATLPFGVWYDEAVIGLGAEAILASSNYRPIFFVENQNPAANLYLSALAMQFLGDTPVALRSVTAIAGTLGIPAVFLLVRRLFGSPRIALIAAWFVAVASWHITLSRFPTSTAIFTLTLDTLVIYFLTRGLQDRRPSDFAFAGLLLGFDLQFYFPARLLAAPMMVLLLWAFCWRRTMRAAVVQGFGIGLVGLVVAAGPLGWFALRYPEEFNRRLNVASVMPEVERAGNWGPLRDNIDKHLLMFNVAGDRNGRHNLPGRPMLDPLMAPLFLLGIGMTLWLARRPTAPALIVWWATMLLGGILSLNFEAPQSLRAASAVTPALIFAAIPVGALWDRWVRSPWGVYGNPAAAARTPEEPLGWRTLLVGARPPKHERWSGPSARSRVGRAAVPALIVVAMVWLLVVNYRRYFDEWANDFSSYAAHSAAETVVALRLRDLNANDDIYLSQFFAGRPPTVRFLAPDAPEGKLFNAATDLPVRGSAQRTVFFLDPQEQAPFAQLRQYYPSARVEEIRPPFGGAPLVRMVTLSPSDVLAVQGIEARYFAGGEPKARPDLTRRETGIDLDPTTVGVAVPVLAEWRSTLHVPEYGEYRLALDGGPDAELFLDGSRLAGGGESIRLPLAAGNHALIVRAIAASPGAPVRLRWEPPGENLTTIPPNLYYLPPVSAAGLLGKYYRNADWAGDPTLMRIDPQIGSYIHILPMPRPYSVDWSGKIRIDQAGVYRFGTEQISTSQFFLDGRLIIDNRNGNDLREADVQLDLGLHDIQFKFLDRDSYSHVYLYWTPPGREREIIPSALLLPPQGADLPVAERLPAGPSNPAVRIPTGVIQFAADRPLPLRVEMSYGLNPDGRLNEPRDAALDASGNLHVLDGQTRRVVVFAADGSFRRAYAGSDATGGRLQEPTGIAIGSTGRVYVLDATTAAIHQYDPDGVFLGTLPLERSDFYKPRGFSIDHDDNLYVSDTGQNRVIKFSPVGRVLAVYGGTKGAGPGEMLEPTDAAALPNGELLVLDTGNKRLQWFDPTGRYRAEWPIAWSVPLNGPHLAVDERGRAIVTDPERGRIARYDAEAGIVQLSGADGFRLPVGIVIDAAGKLYLVETAGNKVTRISIAD